MGDLPKSVRRVGRVQQIAHDATPLHTSAPDIDARTGWLLAMTRLRREPDDLADGHAFIRALGEHGVAASRSAVSRWESGDIAPSYDVLRGYESALGLSAGVLTGLVGYLRASAGSGARRPSLDPSAAEFPGRLDELIDNAEDGVANAVDWQQLGWHLAATPLVHLRRQSWQVLARRIVDVVPRSVGPAELLYDNAVGDLAVVPRFRDFLLDAVEEFLADPGAQVITSPFNLLDHVATKRAGDLVLDMFEEPRSAPIMLQSISMVKRKLERGDFTSDQRARLGMQVLRQWRADPERSARRLAELIAVLPEGLRGSLTAAATRSGEQHLEYVVEHAEVPSASGDGLAADIARGAQRRAPGTPVYAEDRMLPRLLREALYHRDAERRQQATRLLAASPFGPGVCDELLALLADPACPSHVRLSASWAIRFLARDQHRMRILRLVDSPDELISAPVTLALGHIGFDGVSDQVLRSSMGRTLAHGSRAAMYSLGMTGSPGLAGLVRSAAAPDWQRSAAAWWVRHGSAVHV